MLINGAMIMGLVCGSLHPSVLIVTDPKSRAYTTYTQSLGFRVKDWGGLPPYFVKFAADCGYVCGGAVKPLCRTGLIVKVGEVSPIPEKIQKCEIETVEERLVEQFLLDNSVFANLLQDKGTRLPERTSKRQRTNQLDNFVSYQGYTYKKIRKLSNLLDNLMLMACDDLISLLPNRPVNSEIRANQIGILVLGHRSRDQSNRKKYILDERDFLRLILTVWGRSKMLPTVAQAPLPNPESLEIVKLAREVPDCVQCSGCKKWHELPSSLNPDSLPEEWYCKMNDWGPCQNSCDAPEQSSRGSGSAITGGAARAGFSGDSGNPSIFSQIDVEGTLRAATSRYAQNPHALPGPGMQWFDKLPASEQEQIQIGIKALLYAGCMAAARRTFDAAVEEAALRAEEAASDPSSFPRNEWSDGPLAANKVPPAKKPAAATPAAPAKDTAVVKPADAATTAAADTLLLLSPSIVASNARKVEHDRDLESYRKLKKYQGVTILKNKTMNNRVRAGVRPGKALHDTLGKNRIFMSETEDKPFNITEAAWAHDMIMFVLSGIHNIPDKKEKIAHLRALQKNPPYYVRCESDTTTRSLHDDHVLIQGIFGNRENLQWPLNFYNLHLVNPAWLEEKKARKPLKLKRFDDERKVTIFRAAVEKIKDYLRAHRGEISKDKQGG